MDYSSLFWALVPVLVILFMLLVFKKPADISGIVGWLAVSLVAVLFFKTSFEVVG